MKAATQGRPARQVNANRDRNSLLGLNPAVTFASGD